MGRDVTRDVLWIARASIVLGLVLGAFGAGLALGESPWYFVAALILPGALAVLGGVSLLIWSLIWERRWTVLPGTHSWTRTETVGSELRWAHRIATNDGEAHEIEEEPTEMDRAFRLIDAWIRSNEEEKWNETQT